MRLFLKFSLIFLILGCQEEISIPKPPTHLRVDLPEHSYKSFTDSVNYSFEGSKLWSIRMNMQKQDSMVVYLGKEIDGDLHLQYFKIDSSNTLAKLLNQSFAKIDFHKIRAKQMIDTNFVIRNKNVYGSFYEFIGNSATNFQFYLTDSTDNFVRTELLIRRKPNYDSLQPTLHYIKKDLLHLINTFEWKNKN